MQASNSHMPQGVDTIGTVHKVVNRHIESCVVCIRHMRCWLICVVSLVGVMVSPRCHCLLRVTAFPRTTGRYETCCSDLGGKSATCFRAATQERRTGISDQKCQATLHPGARSRRTVGQICRDKKAMTRMMVQSTSGGTFRDQYNKNRN